MVAGMKFLSKKGFNPQNKSNRERVWEAQQEKKNEEKKLRERREQLQRERDDEELAKARGEQVHLKFMYQPPPGLETSAAVEKQKDDGEDDVKPKALPVAPVSASSSSQNDITQIQPGDDPAAAAFRRMIAAATTTAEDDEEEQTAAAHTNEAKSFGDNTVLQGTTIERQLTAAGADKKNENLSALEKAVGRRDGNRTLSLEEQVARFPQLKNAPMAKGMNATDVGVSFKPLGAQLRNVRCLACGVWGHSRGERECPKNGWNPFAITAPAGGGTAAATTIATKKDKAKEKSQQPSSRHSKEEDSDSKSSGSGEEDSYRERKRRKKEKRRKHRERSRRSDSSSEEGDRKRRKRSRSPPDRRSKLSSRKKNTSRKERKSESSRRDRK